jgi:hypothetical protein
MRCIVQQAATPPSLKLREGTQRPAVRSQSLATIPAIVCSYLLPGIRRLRSCLTSAAGAQDSRNEIKAFRELAQDKDFDYDSDYQPENGHEERQPDMANLNREKVSSVMDKLDSATSKKKK